MNPHVPKPVKVQSENKRGRPQKQQKTTHVPGEVGGTTTNVPIETRINAHATTKVETCIRRRGRGRGRGGSSGRENNTSRIDVTTRGGIYLENVIPIEFLTTTGGDHGIIIRRKIAGFTSTSTVLTEVLCNCFM